MAAAVGVAAWLFLFRGGSGLTGDDLPAFSFDLRRVRSVATDANATKASLRQAAGDVRATLDAMYLAGFVDPDRWEAGTFPEVLEAFSSETAAGAEEDLAQLTVGPSYAELVSVTPRRSRLDVEFLLGDDELPFAAVATTSFSAQATLGEGGKLEVTHEGRYVMRPIDGRWVIVGYQVNGALRPAPRPASERSP